MKDERSKNTCKAETKSSSERFSDEDGSDADDVGACGETQMTLKELEKEMYALRDLALERMKNSHPHSSTFAANVFVLWAIAELYDLDIPYIREKKKQEKSGEKA